MNRSPATGTPATREFYDNEGWKRTGGQLTDQALFGVRNDGPIRQELHRVRCERIRQALGGPGLRLVEFGCGGTPATWLTDLCDHLTVVDFSQTGLAEAARALGSTGVEFETVAADMCQLPFTDESFDAAFSAHAIYHIDNAAAQAKAFGEIMRVVRRGGTAVFVLANPYPLMFPIRSTRRAIAVTPGIARLLNRLRPKPKLPYLPMRLGWMRRELRRWGDVQIIGYRMASTAVNQNVPEAAGIGRALWRLMRSVELRFPRAAARMGNYVTIIVRKR